MDYVFATTSFKRSCVGGPRACAKNMENMLSRYADFSYKIVKDNFDPFFSKYPNPKLVHIQSDNNLIKLAMKRKLRIILGPNVVWQKVPKEIFSYPKIVAILIRGQKFPIKKQRKIWKDKIKTFPSFVDEKFFRPKTKTKKIDVLTISKSFQYLGYNHNHKELTKQLEKINIKHVYLRKYILKDFKRKLNETKLLLFPSPHEAGSTACHALLETSMMNVPFIVLKSMVTKKDIGYDSCRGLIAENVKEMAKLIKPTLKQLDDFSPREWTIKRFSYLPAYNRLAEIIKDYL